MKFAGTLSRREFVAGALALPTLACAVRRQRGSSTWDASRLGASTACLAGFSLLDAIRQIEQMGFGTIEMIAYTGARHSIGAIPGFAYDESTPEQREDVFRATRAFRHISAHLPFDGVRLFSSSATDRHAGLERVQTAMDGLAFLRGELAVMHVGWPDEGKRFRDIWQPMIDTLRALGEYAADRNLRLGIETMQPDSGRDYMELVFAVDHPRVGAVIDTGHIRGSTDIGLPPEQRDSEEARARFNDVLNTIVTTLGDKVFHFHLSDVRRTDWLDHRTIGSGIVDFSRLFATMRVIDYDRLLVFELEMPDQIEALSASKSYVEVLLDRST